MGGCYSSTSHRLQTSPRQTQMKEKRNSKKGMRYAPVNVTNGDSQNQQPPSKDSSCQSISGDNTLHQNSHFPSVLDKEKKVVPSDSGVESLGCPQEDSSPDAMDKKELTLCPSCYNKLKKITCGSCHSCGLVRIDSAQVSALVNMDTYCTCGPRQPGKMSVCRTHGVKGSSTSSGEKSDILSGVLKSNEEKSVGDKREYDRLHIKGGNSVISCQVCSCSSGLRQFRAPLAEFDSVDNQLNDETNKGEECDSVLIARNFKLHDNIGDLADFVCKCDLSSEQPPGINICGKSTVPNTLQGSAQTQSAPVSPGKSLSSNLQPRVGGSNRDLLSRVGDDSSGHGVSKSENPSGSTSNSELEIPEALQEKTDKTSHLRFAVTSVLEGMSIDSEELLCPVTLTVQGRHVVVMDASTHAKMLNDLVLLKEQLHHLIQIIQEEAEIGPLDLSMTLTGD